MSDKSYLDWPFLEPRHAALEAALDAWAVQHLAHAPDHAAHDHAGVDAACRQRLVLARSCGSFCVN